MKYICELCGTVYDEAQGEPKQGVQAGTPFDKLPPEYYCPGCGSGREAFNSAVETIANRARMDTQAFWQSVKYADNKLESER